MEVEWRFVTWYFINISHIHTYMQSPSRFVSLFHISPKFHLVLLVLQTYTLYDYPLLRTHLQLQSLFRTLMYVSLIVLVRAYT